MVGALTSCLALSACGAPPPLSDPTAYMVASFQEMSAEGFSVRAVAPAEVVREYAICKGIWFAEKQKAQQVSFSDPIFDDQDDVDAVMARRGLADGWAVVRTRVHLGGPGPEGNPIVNVAEVAAECRASWDWYR